MEPHSEEKGRLGGKFEQFSHAPSEDVWERIAAEPVDRPLGSKFWAFTWAPKAQVWRRIAGELHPVPYLRIAGWAAAASLALLVGIGAWQLGGSDGQKGMALVEPVRDWSCLPSSLADAQHGHDEVRHDDAHLASDPGMERHKPRNGDANQGHFMASKGNDGHGGNNGNVQLPFPGTSFPEKLLQPSGMTYRGATLRIGTEGRDRIGAGHWSMAMIAEAKEAQRLELLLLQNQQALADDLQEEEASPLFAMASANMGGTGSFANKLNDFSEREEPLSLDPNAGYASPDAMEASQDASRPSEDFRMPVIVGMGLEHRVWKRLSVGAGLAYTYMASTRDYQSGTVDQHQQILRQYLGVNGSLYYQQPLGKSRFAAYASTGVQYDFGLGYKSSLSNKVAGVQVSTEDNATKLASQASVNAGVGLRYRLLPQLGVYAQAGASHYFYQGGANLYSQKPIWPVAQLGLRLEI